MNDGNSYSWVSSVQTSSSFVSFFLKAAIILSWAAIVRTQAATNRDPSNVVVPGSSFHHRASVTRIIRISVERSIDMSVGLWVMEMARVMVQ